MITEQTQCPECGHFPLTELQGGNHWRCPDGHELIAKEKKLQHNGNCHDMTCSSANRKVPHGVLRGGHRISPHPLNKAD